MSRKQKQNIFQENEKDKRELRNRISIIVFLFFLIIGLLTFDFYNREFQNWSNIDTNLNIFLLININIILLITVTSLLLRNVIKLIYERKKRLLGFRLKSKLTLAFIVISSLPTIVFFVIANGFLTNSLNFWFKGQYSLGLKNAAAVVKHFSDDWDKGLTHYANVLVADIVKENVPNGKENQWFYSKLFRYRLDGVVLYDSNLEIIQTWFSADDKAELWKPIDQTTLRSGLKNSSLKFNESVGEGHLYRAIVPLNFKDNQSYIEVVRILPGNWFTDLETARDRLANYEKLVSLEDPIRTNYQSYLLLIAALLIFSSSWFGIYLARSIVVPIETLVDGTRRVSKGDLDFHINLQQEDEIGMLLKSFNKMTEELRLNRIKLAKSREELIQTNKALEERNIFVELVLQTLQTGVFSIDNSGYVNTINPYMISLFDLNSNKILGRHYRTVFTKEQLMVLQQINDELEESKDTQIKKDAFLTINKKSLHISFQLFQFHNPQGQMLGRLLVVEDLTEIDRLTRARAWREVAKRIAHEIKNPLTPIKLSAQRIRRKFLELDTDTKIVDKCTQTIIDEVDALKNMVNEFSQFARLPEISPSPQNINSILLEIHDLYLMGAPSNVTLNLELSDEIPLIMLDKEQIKRAFTNLVENAIDALENEKGVVTLFSDYSPDWKIAVLKVIDDGCGIPLDKLGRIFDPYITTKKHGTGLGLAIVHQIISDHGGFIRVEENVPKGTVFTIELPVDKKAVSNKPS